MVSVWNPSFTDAKMVQSKAVDHDTSLEHHVAIVFGVCTVIIWQLTGKYAYTSAIVDVYLPYKLAIRPWWLDCGQDDVVQYKSWGNVISCLLLVHRLLTLHLQVDVDWTSVENPHCFKVVFLGDSNVGKTCLAKLYVEEQVVENSQHTIGFDHHTKNLELEDGITAKVRACVWTWVSWMLIANHEAGQ